jgi:hypothetical protein
MDQLGNGRIADRDHSRRLRQKLNSSLVRKLDLYADRTSTAANSIVGSICRCRRNETSPRLGVACVSGSKLDFFSAPGDLFWM